MAPQPEREGIAIVGMACRLPGDVSCPESFWNLLINQRLARGPVPANRFNSHAFYNPQKGRPGTIRYTEGYYINNDIESFDGAFFGMSGADVQCLDPQQRQLLECCFEAMESGGITLAKVANTTTGVYVGNFVSDYEALSFKEPERIEGMSMLGMGRTTMANRVSYLYNLQGPSVTLDTACSSTMYALHFAVQALRHGEIPAAFVAGTNLLMSLEYHLAISQIGALSPTAMCHAFDASADGYARGESINVLYLKRVSDALRDGDPIRAVIRGTSLTANGKNNGITLPSAASQELSIRRAYENAGGLDYSSIGFFECHGTGTAVGDPIETTAIANVFSDSVNWLDPLLIGSTKPQVGHGEAGSALTSVIKVVLAMEKGIIPGTIGINKLNPNLNLRGGKIAVVEKNLPWPATKAKRASVNSSGYGGANGHAVIETLEEYLKGRDIKDLRTLSNRNHLSSIRQTKFMLPLSNHDEYSLTKNIERTFPMLQKQTYDIQDLLYTMAERRSMLSYRAAIPVTVSKDNSVIVGEPVSGRTRLSEPIIGFIFTGQGAQWAQMGKQLLSRFESVKATFTKLNQALAKLEKAPQWTLEDIIVEPAETSKIADVAFAQPICTALQIALVDLLREWGVNPVATVGHSSGELGAAYAAGLVSAADAIAAAYLRGLHASFITSHGAMMVIAMGPAAAETLLEEHGVEPDDVVVACHNSPDSVTLSGSIKTIDALQSTLRRRSIMSKKLPTGGKAYHSPHVKEVGLSYRDSIFKADAAIQSTNRLSNGLKNGRVAAASNKANGIQDSKSSSPVMISSVTLEPLEPRDVVASYWQKNLESPVLFDGALKRLLGLTFGIEERHVDCLIEIGPHNALKGAVKQIVASAEVKTARIAIGTTADIAYEHTLERHRDAEEDMMRLASRLFVIGCPINILQVNAQSSYRPEKILIDLPLYPWNHSVSQPLLINRATSDYKFATHPRHDLIGARLPGGNRMEPTWRNYLRVKDAPWIQDHVIGKSLIVPGAAYIAMAIEAAAQFAEDTTLGATDFNFEDARFHLRTVNLKAAMVLPDIGTADVMINLRPTETSFEIKWFEFKICSVANDRWVEHANGCISYEMVNGEKRKKTNFAWEEEEPVFEEKITKEAWYQKLEYRGFEFGPLFRIIDEIESLPHMARARATAPILKTAEKTTPHESRYAVHPLTIDAVLQGSVVAAYRGRADKVAGTQVPVFVEDIVIHPASWAKNQIGVVDSVAWEEGARTGGSHSRLTTKDGFDIISMMGIRWRQFENQGSQENMTKPDAREPYYRLHWKPDIELLDSRKAKQLYQNKFRSPSEVQFLDEVKGMRTRLETVTILYICQTLDQFKRNELPTDLSLAWTHAFYNWMVDIRDKAAAGQVVLCDKDATKLNSTERAQRIEQLLSELPADFPQLEYNTIVFKNVTGILNGTVSGVELAVKSDILGRVYTDGAIHDAARKNLASIVDLLAHKNPRMRILEVGAGTGSCTSVALDVLNSYDEGAGHAQRYIGYTFTDVSPSFFQKAEGVFAKYPALNFKTFDAGKDPVYQGFEYNRYDLILASNVLHAPGNTDNLLGNCRNLLKPGGKLVMCEISEVENLTPVQFAFGTIPSFWECLDDADQGRPGGPFRSLPSWHEQLLKSGFSGNDMILADYPAPLALESIIMSTAIDIRQSKPDTNPSDNILIVHTAGQDDLAAAVSRVFGLLGAKITHISLASLPRLTFPTTPIICIVLEEIEDSVLVDMEPAQFEGLKRLVQSASSILWVTGGDLLSGKKPALAMAHGMTTAVMNENSARNLRFATLDIDVYSSSDLPILAKYIYDISSTVARATSRVHCDTDYILKDGVIQISRLVPDMQLNNEFTLDSGDGRAKQDYPTSGNTQLALAYPGLLDSIYFREKPTCQIDVGTDEIEIEVKAVGLNMKDYMIAMGNFESMKSSNECTGIVARVSANVKDFAPGDKVICLERGYYDTYLRSPVTKCLKLRESDDLVEMATVGIAYCTALYALKYLAQLEAGETILIQAATGSLGIAAIQYARSVGAEIYATVGTQAKRDYLISEWQVQDDHIFWSRSAHFEPPLKRKTNGKGIDVILSTISGAGFYESVRCLASCGRLVDVGRGNVMKKGNIGLHAFDKSTSIFSFDLNFVLEEKPKVVARLLKDVMQLLKVGKIAPIRVDSTFHITEMEKALRYFGLGQHIGKVVLTYGATENKVKIKGVRNPRGFTGGNSYLLSGCHGGLGHSMADWMIQHGAKNLVFLSRSGEDKLEIASFVRKARSRGINVVTIQGDVSKAADVKRAVTQATSMGSLRGVIHAAMVLQDSFLETMSLEKYNMAVRPKVHGALNLHNATVEANSKLDFFLMTSSTVTFVGHISQSNYAAANAVLDNLARHRRSMGLAATSISLGPIKGVGTLSRNSEYTEHLLRSGLIETPEAEFLQYFEKFIKDQDFSEHFDNGTQGHIVTGVAYSKQEISMVQVSRIEEDPRSALLVTMLESRKSVEDSDLAANSTGDESLEIPSDKKEAVPILANAVVRRLAKLLFIAPEDIDINRPLSHLGIDSMSGSELIHWLMKRFSVGMSFLELLAPTCTSKNLASTIFNATNKTKANEVVVNVINGTSKTATATNGEAKSNANGQVEVTKMETFTEVLKKSMAGPKPVMHSYVCSVVNQKGQQLYTAEEGIIEAGSTEKVGFDSIYWIASMTKLMTVVTVMLCVERGQISLDDDVADLLPDLCSLEILDGPDASGKYSSKRRQNKITLRLLLTHQSGCGYDTAPQLTRWAKQNGHHGSVFDCDFKVMKMYPLLFEPGSSWMYGSGVDWAGELVARLNNTSLEDFMQVNIWTPLGMTSTSFHPEKRPDMLRRTVASYERTDNGGLLRSTPYSKIPAIHDCGGHGLWSSPRDWTKLLCMFLADGQPLLTKKSVDEIFKRQLVDPSALQVLLDGPLRASLRVLVNPEASRLDFSLGGPLYLDAIPGKRSAGTIQWTGHPNLFWWIDREKGIAATTFTQVISRGDPAFLTLTSTFEKAVYSDFGSLS